jgi:hypothetical protein
VDQPLAERVLDFLTLANGALNGAYRALHQAADTEHPDLCPAELRETLEYDIQPGLEWPLP